MKYSNTTKGFYDEAIHATIPNDAVTITVEEWQALLEGQSNGQIISFNGTTQKPELIDAPLPTNEDLANAVRSQRDVLLAATDWVHLKYQELGQAIPTSMLTYRQELRDITSQPGFPTSITWPVLPTL